MEMNSSSSTLAKRDDMEPSEPHTADDGESRQTTEPLDDRDIEKQVLGKFVSPRSPSSVCHGRSSTASPQNEKPGQAATGLPLDDSQHPVNFAHGTKILINIVLNIWVLSLTYSSTAYVASVPAIMQRFGLGRTAAIVGVTLTVLGFAAGPLCWGPMSEVLGRRRVYVLSGVGYIAFAWGMACANDAATLLVARFFVGFFGASSINNVPASIGDFTTLVQRGPFTILYALCAFAGPVTGPLVSSFIEVHAGYRWNFRVMAIFITVSTIAAALVPETHAPTIFKRKLVRQDIALGLGFFIGCALLATVGTKYYTKESIKAKQANERTPAEARLILSYFGAILCPISLIVFAWTAPFTHVHWAAPLVGEMLFGWSMLSIFTSFVPYLIDTYHITMSRIFAQVAREPALLPLVAAVGAGCVGAGAFAVHYLRSSPDVVIAKSKSRDPWNQITQGQNTKLFSYQPDFWAGRANMPDPRAMFKQDGANDQAAVERAKAIKDAKLRAAKDDLAAH
ncbi:hypothetical protein OIV83_002697 [Microbotryomycetes sp. JL201]|nr:hypothetical protein OIV83_002697 [Microbotryomycetes sp. JL201]